MANYKKALESIIQRPLSEKQWEVLTLSPAFTRLSNNEGSFDEWVKESVQTLKAFEVPLPERISSRKLAQTEFVPSPESDAPRFQIDLVRGHLLAQKANEVYGIQFKLIRNRFKDLDESAVAAELEQWALDELRSEHVPDQLKPYKSTLELPQDQASFIDWPRFYESLIEMSVLHLDLYLPKLRDVYRIYIYLEDGIVAGIARYANFLAGRYHWSHAEAAAFIVFGHMPTYSSRSVTWAQSDVHSILNRIVLVLDPTLSPEEVREIYRAEVRKRTKYPTRISEKHLYAAYFRYILYPNKPWKEVFEMHCDYFADEVSLQFGNAKTFKRDVEKAYFKLLEPEFDDMQYLEDEGQEEQE